MHLTHTVLALPLTVALTTCAAGQSSTPAAPLAQYPGAPLEDRDGNLWFSTVLEGLIRYDGEEFVTFTTADGLASDCVRDLLEADDGTLWIATTGGVTRYDGRAFTTLTDYGEHPVTRTFAAHGDHRDVWDVHLDREGRLWIATMDGVFRRDDGVFEPFPLPVTASAPAFEFGPRMVYCILEDPDGALWFGTDGAGAVRFDGSGFEVRTTADGLASDRVCALLRDGRGDLWFGTSGGGVSRYDGTSFTTHLRSESFSEHTGWGRYLGLLEDRQGNVWFGVSAAGGGVHRWDGEAFRFFSQADGLGDGGVPSLSVDRSGTVWLGTTAGVFRLEGERFVHFGRGGQARRSGAAPARAASGVGCARP